MIIPKTIAKKLFPKRPIIKIKITNKFGTIPLIGISGNMFVCKKYNIAKTTNSIMLIMINAGIFSFVLLLFLNFFISLISNL